MMHGVDHMTEIDKWIDTWCGPYDRKKSAGLIHGVDHMTEINKWIDAWCGLYDRKKEASDQNMCGKRAHQHIGNGSFREVWAQPMVSQVGIGPAYPSSTPDLPHIYP